MNESIKAVHLAHTDGELSDVSAFGSGATARAATFHRSLPTYEPTPLADLRRLSAVLGLSRLAVKDESGRFGLNAFNGAWDKLCGCTLSRAISRARRERDDL